MVGFKELAPIALGFIVLAIILAVGSIVVSDLREDQRTTEAFTVTNQSVTLADNATTVTGVSGSGITLSLTQVLNQSSAINIANFTLSNNLSLAWNAGDDASYDYYFGSDTTPDLNVSFTWSRDVRDGAYNATTSGLSALDNMTSQTPLLATVIIFAVIIGIVIGFFAISGKKRMGGGGYQGI